MDLVIIYRKRLAKVHVTAIWTSGILAHVTFNPGWNIFLDEAYRKVQALLSSLNTTKVCEYLQMDIA